MKSLKKEEKKCCFFSSFFAFKSTNFEQMLKKIVHISVSTFSTFRSSGYRRSWPIVVQEVLANYDGGGPE